MTTNRRNPKIDAFLRGETRWRPEMKKLREILLEFPFTEELKWGKPCYTFQGANVVVMLPLKERCTLMFCKGALLTDTKGLLYRPSENTQAMRQFRFSGLDEIVKMQTVIKSFLKEAIEVEKAGLEVAYKKPAEQAVPEEFQDKLEKDSTLKKAFKALTPGRQRAYLLHFAAPKQSATRDSRIEKCRAMILAGQGLNDEYRSGKKSAR